MRISLNWLRDYLPTDLADTLLADPNELAHRLTMLGLEVEGQETYQSIPGGLEGVVVGCVQDLQPHPNADKLRVATVDVGPASEQPLQIVCGAPNVAAGQYVPVALVGATIYPEGRDPLTLKKAKLRGVESRGMICAEDELGLGESHAGILVLATQPDSRGLHPGQPLSEVYPVYTDTIFEIGLTPNRADAMSHYGVARDLAAAQGRRLPLPERLHPETPAQPQQAPCPIQVEVQDTEKCPRYCGAVLDGVQVGPAPNWLKYRLESIGQRSINNVVDVTNFVLHGIGQPLHAFDRHKIAQDRIVVRSLEAGTPFRALDGVERKLAAEDLMITDPQQGLCMAGVMGGAESGVTEATTAVFLESAYFQPGAIRRSSRRHGLFSETAYRYARGVDPNLAPLALDLALALLAQVAGGERTQAVEAGTGPAAPFEIALRPERARRRMGLSLSDNRQKELLEALDCKVEPLETAMSAGEAAWRVEVPPYRVDVTRPADLMEELLRLEGLDKVPNPPEIRFQQVQPSTDERNWRLQERTADALAALGWREILTNSLVPAPANSTPFVELTNPLSEELAVMRRSLLYSGLQVVAWNQHRQQSDLRLFEFGRVYLPALGERPYQETPLLGLWLAGKRSPEHWSGKPPEAHFFTLVQALEQLWQGLGLQVEAEEQLTEANSDEHHLDFGLVYRPYTTTNNKPPQLDPTAEGVPLAIAGRVHPKYLGEAQGPVFFAEVNWSLCQQLAPTQAQPFQPLQQFPSVRRDISLAVTPAITWKELKTRLQPVLQDSRVSALHLFDRFELPQSQLPQGQDEHRVSYALALTFRHPERTLKDKEVDKLMEQAFQALEKGGQVMVRRG